MYIHSHQTSSTCLYQKIQLGISTSLRNMYHVCLKLDSTTTAPRGCSMLACHYILPLSVLKFSPYEDFRANFYSFEVVKVVSNLYLPQVAKRFVYTWEWNSHPMLVVFLQKYIKLFSLFSLSNRRILSAIYFLKICDSCKLLSSP